MLAETVWVLGTKKYQFDKPDIIRAITALFEDARFCFEDSQAVWQALNDYRKAVATNEIKADFPDALIAAKAKPVARQKGFDLVGVYSFDSVAQRLFGMLPVN